MNKTNEEIMNSAEKHIKDIKNVLKYFEASTESPLFFYTYVEKWNDEGVFLIITTVENEGGESLENIVGLISGEMGNIEKFDKTLRAKLAEIPSLFKIWQQNNIGTPFYNC